ncbi:MAG: ATP-grasp domain-containing protein [Lachnospiraceae bacterium]|nr:ATP-grasp domain-containing protein [Lachnospiraceae bacterium]
MKKALVLAGGLPQIELINELKQRGYYTILADYSVRPLAEKYADKFYRESTLDIPKITEIALEEKADMIISCCTDQALSTVAVVADKLGLPCYIDEQTGWNVTNKREMKRIFKENGIPTAPFVITDTEDVNVEMKYPLVVKPVDCNSSKGVVKVYRAEELKEAIKGSLAYSRDNKAIIEEFVDGEEISVDAFVTDGKVEILCTSCSEKINNDRGFVIWKGISPATDDANIIHKIYSIICKIVDAFKLNNCPMLVQMIKHGEELSVIEFSARTGGCLKYRMIEKACGFDVIKATVDLFESRKVNINLIEQKKMISDEFLYCNAGVFDHIEGADICKKNGWITEFYELKRKGTEFHHVGCSGDRVAAILIEAENYDEYVDKHNKVAASLKVIDVSGNDIMRHDLYPVL